MTETLYAFALTLAAIPSPEYRTPGQNHVTLMVNGLLHPSIVTTSQPDGTQIGSPLQLKNKGDTHWEQGSVHDIVTTFAMPQRQAGVGRIKISLSQSNSACFNPDCDNWNISGLEFRLLTGNRTPEMCDIDLPDQNWDPPTDAVARLSRDNGSLTLSMPQPGDWGDDLRGNSELNALVVFADSTSQKIALKAKGAPDWGEDTVHNVRVRLNRPTPTTKIDHIDLQMVEHPDQVCNILGICISEGDDNWNVAGINVVTWTEGKPLENCEYSMWAPAPSHFFLRMGKVSYANPQKFAQGILMSFDPDTSAVASLGPLPCGRLDVPNDTLAVDRGGRVYLFGAGCGGIDEIYRLDPRSWQCDRPA